MAAHASRPTCAVSSLETNCSVIPMSLTKSYPPLVPFFQNYHQIPNYQILYQLSEPSAKFREPRSP